jgi:hypothetical protein
MLSFFTRSALSRATGLGARPFAPQDGVVHAFQEDFTLLDVSQHGGEFFSPPGGASPDALSTKAARPTVETLRGAAAAVHSVASANGSAAADGHSAAAHLPPMHPSPVSTSRRISVGGGGVGSAGASPIFSASGPARFSGPAGKVGLRPGRCVLRAWGAHCVMLSPAA